MVRTGADSKSAQKQVDRLALNKSGGKPQGGAKQGRSMLTMGPQKMWIWKAGKQEKSPHSSPFPSFFPAFRCRTSRKSQSGEVEMQESRVRKTTSGPSSDFCILKFAFTMLTSPTQASGLRAQNRHRQYPYQPLSATAAARNFAFPFCRVHSQTPSGLSTSCPNNSPPLMCRTNLFQTKLGRRCEP